MGNRRPCPPWPDLVNTPEGMVLGPYRVMERIGRGGMASVYRAYHPALDRYVAIKILPDFFADEPEYRERFQQEARSVARLKHPNILEIFDYGYEGGLAYLQHGTPWTLAKEVAEMHFPAPVASAFAATALQFQLPAMGIQVPNALLIMLPYLMALVAVFSRQVFGDRIAAHRQH